MPRRRMDIDKSEVANDIMAVLEAYAKDEQFYPTQNGLFSHMRRMGYKHSIGSFNYWFSRLAQAGKVEIDWINTRAIRAVSLVIVEREDTEPTQRMLSIPLLDNF